MLHWKFRLNIQKNPEKACSLMWYRLCEPRKRPDMARSSFSLHVVRCNCAGLFFANAAVLRLLRLVIMEPFRHWLIAIAPCYKPLTNCDLAKQKDNGCERLSGKSSEQMLRSRDEEVLQRMFFMFFQMFHWKKKKHCSRLFRRTKNKTSQSRTCNHARPWAFYKKLRTNVTAKLRAQANKHH